MRPRDPGRLPDAYRSAAAVARLSMSGIHRILVPTDFSAASRAALDLACDLAARLSLPLIVMHAYAVRAYPLPDGSVLATPEETAREVAEATPELAREVERARARVGDVESVFVEGEPFDAIVRVARERAIDLIVMGSHGRRGIKHALLGSVAEKMVQRGPCPVLVVRFSDEHAQSSRE